MKLADYRTRLSSAVIVKLVLLIWLGKQTYLVGGVMTPPYSKKTPVSGGNGGFRHIFRAILVWVV